MFRRRGHGKSPFVEDRVCRRETIDSNRSRLGNGEIVGGRYVSRRFASSCIFGPMQVDQSRVWFRSCVCDSIVILLLYMV